VGRAFLKAGGERSELPSGFGSIESFGEALFGAWLLPFELVSALLVVAMVAALVLAKRRT
jgi:NADH-quinone oxidoreductase subunit J